MPVTASDIQLRLSGGALNSNPLLSLGGAKSSVQVTLATLFDSVADTESTAGRSEVRCVYLHNAHATIAWEDVVAWLTANTANSATNIQIGLGSSAANGVEQTVGAEQSTPVSVTFSSPSAKVDGLAVGDIPAGQHRALWFRRIVTAGSGASTDTATLRAEGATVQ